MTALIFPESAEDLNIVFDNALRTGAMQLDQPDKVNFWARHEFLAHDAAAGEDVFFNSLSGLYVRVPRKEEST